MSNHLLEKLEEKIDNVIETIEMLRIEIEDLELKNKTLIEENTGLKGRQSQWEQGLNKLLNKLDNNLSEGSQSEIKRLEMYEREVTDV